MRKDNLEKLHNLADENETVKTLLYSGYSYPTINIKSHYLDLFNLII